MSTRIFRIARRDVLMLAAATFACPAAAAVPPPLGQRLESALKRADLGFPARLSVVDLTEQRRFGALSISAVVEMRWAPGLRRRSFLTEGRDETTALDAIVSDIINEFSGAGRGAVGPRSRAGRS